MLFVARLAVKLLPSPRIFAFADRPLRHHQRFNNEQANWVIWAIDTANTKPWLKVLCLPRALATQTMLRRRGIASRLCLGVGRTSGDFSAHAWVEIVGDKRNDEVAGFARIAEFGGKT